MNSTSRRWLTALVASATLAGSLLATGPAQANQTSKAATTSVGTASPAATQVVAPIPTLTWSRCKDIPRGLCATALAPLDYDDPTGPTITLDLVKIPALDQTQKMGTLFVNPGGPGGSASEFAPYAADLLGDSVALHYDVIGIDPRGVGRHSQVVCSSTEVPPPFSRATFPITDAQSKALWRIAVYERKACQSGANAILTHLSTADTARDMDLIRQAVGDDLLNYYGISYGTYLGATYAAMFPDRVGRFVVDGVLDPVAWATGDPNDASQPFTTRLKSARGAYEALTTALVECDRLGKNNCAFAGNAVAKWHTLVRLSKQGKVKLGGQRLLYQDLVGFTLGVMYDNQGYDFLGFLLNRLYHDSVAGRPVASRSVAGLTVSQMRKVAREVISSPYSRLGTTKIRDAFTAIACADTANPTGRLAWWTAGQKQDRLFPWFGSLWTWASAPCSSWNPAASDDAFRGPFEVTTANPILVVGNSHDPATPVQGARRFTTLFGGSRFLLMDGWGHGALGTKCVTAAFDAYYATGALPKEGTVCDKDHKLFGGGGGFSGFRPLPRWRPQHLG